MNKVILLGRLTRDPEVRYSQSAEPIAVTRYSLAIAKRFKREGEPDAEFVNCVAFGKPGEFAEKYFRKGLMVGVVGRLQTRSWEDQNGQKRWTTEVVVEEQHFAESKSSFEASRNSGVSVEMPDMPTGPANNQPASVPDGFASIAENLNDEDLPF